MSGKSSRDKGARGELKAAEALRALGIYAERSGRLGLLWGAFRQAELDSRGLLIPVVLAKMVGRSGSSEWVVMHKLQDWPSVVASFASARAKGLPDA